MIEQRPLSDAEGTVVTIFDSEFLEDVDGRPLGTERSTETALVQPPLRPDDDDDAEEGDDG
jgi:hypothetical protein